jgi:hypothetical protein
MLTVAPGFTVALPGAVGIAAQVVPPSVVYCGVPPVVAKIPQMNEGASVPAMVKVGSAVVTVLGVVLSVLGTKVIAFGVRSIVNEKVVVSPLDDVRVPVMVALPGLSPQVPDEGTLTQRVRTLVPGALVTAAEITQVAPASMLNSIHPVAVRVPGASAQVKEAVPGIVVGAAAPVIPAGSITAGGTGKVVVTAVALLRAESVIVSST